MCTHPSFTVLVEVTETLKVMSCPNTDGFGVWPVIVVTVLAFASVNVFCARDCDPAAVK